MDLSGKERTKVIIRTGIIGIIANLLLSAFKAIAGLAAGSVAIVLDAVNNLSDALSSIITIAGTKIAEKPADKDHPMGHGRAEHLAALIIAFIILFAGATSMIQAVKKIIHPASTHYTALTLTIIIAAIAVKVVLGLYTKKTGKKVRSDSLIGSGTDALMDALISLATLISAIINMIWDISIDGWIGAGISVFILKAGYDMLSQIVSTLLGKRADAELTTAIKAEVTEGFPQVMGVYDLFLESYGHGKMAGSMHIEIPDDMTAIEIHRLTRKISMFLYNKFGAIITCGIYAVNAHDETILSLRKEITELTLSHDGVLQLHGFFEDKKNMTISFDIVIDFEVDDPDDLIKHLIAHLKQMHPEYDYYIHTDIDYSD